MELRVSAELRGVELHASFGLAPKRRTATPKGGRSAILIAAALTAVYRSLLRQLTRSPSVVVELETGCFVRFCLVVLDRGCGWLLRPLTARRLRPTFFSSTLILMILKSCSRPCSSLEWSPPSPASEMWQRPSTPSAISTNAPNCAVRRILPWTTSPTRCEAKKLSQTSGCNCLMPSERRRFCGSTPRTTAFTFSPFFTTSEGCLTRLVQLRFETWTRPSMPSSISMNAPKSVRLRTRPSTMVPAGILIGQVLPRVLEKLLHAQRDAAVGGIHAENHRVDFVARLDQLGGMLEALGPGHLGEVNQAFDALLELNERAVIGDRKNAAMHLGADRITLRWRRATDRASAA